MLQVGVNGYGTIGKRVADAVRAQPDMTIAGVTKTSPDFAADGARAAGYPLYACDEESVDEFHAAGLAVDGTVAGDARLGADTIRLGDDARIGGDLTYDGDLARADGAVVDGAVTQDAGMNVGPTDGFAIPGVVFTVYGVFVALLVGAVLLLAFPGTAAAVADRATGEPLRTGGIGLLTAVVVPIALAVVAVTIVGIPLALAGSVVFGLLVWLGTIYGRFVLGTWLLSLAGAENRWAALVVGVLVVAVLRLVPVLGALTRFVVFLLGFGALVAVLVGGYRDRRDRRERAPRAPEADDTGAEPAD